VFVTFDFKDLYTNILFEDAKRALIHLTKILGLGGHRTALILEFYQLCNKWN